MEMRRAWPVAQSVAMSGNIAGGKSDGSDPMPESKVFRPEEFLPPWAIPPELNEDTGGPRVEPIPGLSATAARGILAAAEMGLLTGPVWLDFVPFVKSVQASAERGG